MVNKRIFFIFLPLFSILTWLSFPPPALAADCKLDGDGQCYINPFYNYNCTYTAGSGITTNACCQSSSACKDFKIELAAGSTSLANNRQAWNPEGSCPDGIDTALGCLPYKSKNGALTKALLTFATGISGAIALAVMLAGTIQIMTAGGNAEQVGKGKELLTGAIVGLLFIVFSVTLLRLIAGDIIQLEGF